MYRFLRISIIQRKCPLKFSSRNCSGDLTVAKDVLSDDSKQRCKNNVSELIKFVPDLFQTKLRKRAAVLIPLCEVDGKPSVLFTQRAHKLRRSRGEVSFPGGTEDDGDRNLVHTALRETEEEIGLPPSRVDVWTTLPALPDYKFAIGVHAVIGNVGNIDHDEFVINPEEVAHVFTVPITTLCDPKNVAFTKFRVNKKRPTNLDYTNPVYLTEPRIWGLTACLLDIALGALCSHELAADIYLRRCKRFMGR